MGVYLTLTSLSSYITKNEIPNSKRLIQYIDRKQQHCRDCGHIFKVGESKLFTKQHYNEVARILNHLKPDNDSKMV